MKQYLAVASKIITDNSWKTDWAMLAQMFGLEEYPNNTYRLYRSQNWGDDDYPTCVLHMFNSIFGKEGEEKAKAFISYVLQEELKSATEEFLTKNKFLISQLELADSSPELSNIQINFNHFIDIDDLPDGFYRDLHDEINRAYNYGLFSVIPFLMRKFFENLIIDIFKKKYGTSDINKYYDTANHRCHNFLKIVTVLKDNIHDFTHIEKNMDEEFVKLINQYRETGNSTAHSISVKFLEDDIDELLKKSSEVEYIIKLLVRVLNLV